MGCLFGSVMVPLDRALLSFHGLSIVTTSLSAAVWPQFTTQVFAGEVSFQTDVPPLNYTNAVQENKLLYRMCRLLVRTPLKLVRVCQNSETQCSMTLNIFYDIAYVK